VIHNFRGGTVDGNFPVAGVTLDASGNLFGETAYGSAYGGGLLFELLPLGGGKWQEKIVHPWGRIHDGRLDGTYPYGTLVFDAAGNFYGTATIGGIHGGLGMVFKFVPNATNTGWVEQSIHGFGNGTDGQTPLGGVVVDSAGNVYGTTNNGGTYGEGIIYELIPGSTGYFYKVLHNFNGTTDGGWAAAPLVMDNAGHLYGTTEYGGLTTSCTTYPLAGCGVVFELSLPGAH